MGSGSQLMLLKEKGLEISGALPFLYFIGFTEANRQMEVSHSA
jgi:hypothetical protein